MATGVHPVDCGLHEGTDLHGIEPGLDHTEAHAAGAEHGVELVPQLGRFEQAGLLIGEADRGLLDGQLHGVGKELVQRRIEEPDGDGQSVHGLEDLVEVGLLGDSQRLEGTLLLGGSVGQDHAAHDREPVFGQEHVLGPAQADALGPVLAGIGGIGPVVGVGPDAEVAGTDVVGPTQDGVELGGRFALDHVDLSQHDGSVGAVDGDPVPLGHDHVTHAERLRSDAQGFGADYGRLAPAPGHDSGMADQSASGGQDALGGQHAVDVLGGRLGADQHDGLATLGGSLGVIRGHVDPAHCSPRRGTQALDQDLVSIRGELGVEDLLEVLTGDAAQGLLAGQLDGPLGHHVDSHAQCCPTGALAHPGLQHPQLALVDGELGVAHVPVVVLETGEDSQELLVDLRECISQRRQGLGIADASHDILALGVDQEVAVLADGSGGRVAGEAHAGTRVVVAVAEHHGLDVDGGAEVVGDALTDPVGDGPVTVPRGEHGFDGPAQLVVGILGERLAGVALDDLLIGLDQVAQQLDRDACVRSRAGQLLGCIEQRVELLAGHAHDDAAVHGDESAVGVEGEPLVVGLAGQALHRLVVESQVEDGVHHPGHGELGSGPDRHQQRVISIADPLAHGLLQPGASPSDLRRQSLGPAALHVGPARRGGDGEARGNRKGQYRRHLGQVGTLAAEEVLHLHRGLAVRMVEVKDERHQEGSPRWIRGGERSAHGLRADLQL